MQTHESFRPEVFFHQLKNKNDYFEILRQVFEMLFYTYRFSHCNLSLGGPPVGLNDKMNPIGIVVLI